MRALYVKTYRGRWGCYPWEDPVNEDEYMAPPIPKTLDIVPLREFLQHRALAFENSKDYFRRIGMPERTWHRLVYESKRVSVRVADEVITADGTSHLSLIYPELYNYD